MYLYIPHRMAIHDTQYNICYTTADASAGFGFRGDAITVSLIALFPFNEGKSKALHFPPLIPSHLPQFCPSPCVQVNAPTHGCTFHPTSSVTLPIEANFPSILVIWYFGFEFLKRIMPGMVSCSFFGDDFLDLADFFEGFPARPSNFRGLSGGVWEWELMMVSQMIACEGGARDDLLEGQVAWMYTKSCLVFQLKREEKSRGMVNMGALSWTLFGRLLTCVQIKFDMSVFLLLRRVIVWTTFHADSGVSLVIGLAEVYLHLHITQLQGRRWVLRGKCDRKRD